MIDQRIEILTAAAKPADGWNWYAVRYRRPGGYAEVCYQLARSQGDAEKYVSRREPDWMVGDHARPRMPWLLRMIGFKPV